MKKILGLDLGTNSIGWALVELCIEEKIGKILGIGSRIIPMSQDVLGNFDVGNSLSQTAERTGYRGNRRLRERHLLRRERLHRVLNVLGFLPEHYANQIDFEKRLGKFISETEPKLAYNGKEFIFKQSFNEMLEDVRKNNPEILNKKNKRGEDAKIPYDWTIYFLRKKALSQKIEKEEIAWILLNFNQKRGYYQLRGEEEEGNPNKLVEFHSLKILDVVADETPNNQGETWYSLHLENGWIYRRSSKIPLFDWKNKIRDFIVTTDLNDDGTIKTDKEGKEKRSFRAPSEDDWTLLKKKTEADIDQSKQTVGTYIYNTLLQNPSQKIRGKLVRTIERKFYKEELVAILNAQMTFYSELRNEELYNKCIRELYHNYDAHQLLLSKKNFVHLFVDDIIFYQRPLRSKKSSIGNCPLEFRKYKDKGGNEITEYLRSIPKSHPLYQEFRLWQWLFNLKIYTKDTNTDDTPQFITSVADKEKLFDFLNNRKEIDQRTLLKYFKLTDKTHRWNFVEDKTYPCNEIATQIKSRLKKVENIQTDFLTPENEQKLWHIIYSVTDKIEFEKALKKFAKRSQLDEVSFVENFRKFPPLKNEYGSFSEKAIKKLLPLMRFGKYWSWEAIDVKTKERISKIITGEYDTEIKNRVREKAIHLTSENDFQGLQLWLAQYIIYDRHFEANTADRWNTVADLKKYLEGFKQHSLRNPIVEQVITETLRVIKDIWMEYGNGAKNFFYEIHIELGRNMKNTADERRRLTSIVSENENTNLRMKALLMELKKNSDGKLFVENVRPYSFTQQEILKIYEDGIINSDIEIPDDILKISKTAHPKESELQRYKLWLEQKYRSPYTGQVIPLGKLFTPEYEIEHVIPQSRYFDDGLSNKVICETAINKLKDRQLGLEFIKNHHGQIVETGFGKSVTIFEEDAYRNFVKEHYAKNRSKRNKLLLEEIPDKMIERQINDTRYISKFISSVLSNIVREETNDDGINSKNVVPVNGAITSLLKQNWGLNDVWNKIIEPRFKRMYDLTMNECFWKKYKDKDGNTIIRTGVPLELSKGFQKKRIDHRHHAMDALVIACATRDHVNLLNNQFAKSEITRYDLQRKLRNFERVSYFDKKANKQVEREIPQEFLKPWDSFTVDARNILEKVVVSFKQNLRVINKITNKYESYKDEEGNLRIEKESGKPKKGLISQIKGDSWAIRKSLHKDTVFAKVALRKIKTVRLSEALKDWKMIVNKELKQEIKQLISLYGGKLNADIINKHFKDRGYYFKKVDVSKVKLYYFETENAATRKSLDTSFSEKTIKESVTDTGIQKILLNHLDTKDNKPEVAFSPEGIEEMNQNIVQLNDGKPHHPIYKVRVYEPIGNKFQVGTIGNKKNKYVEAAKGTNLFFAIYADENGSRSYETIPLNIVIERLKQGLKEVPERNEKGNPLLLHLSPNDLVYVPTEDEKDNIQLINWNNLDSEQLKRVYKMVSSSGNRCFFIRQEVAIPIVNKIEFSALNKMERSIEGIMIKEVCIKLKINRLGDICKYEYYES
jgi:CRISPR-associated endonuclease Csn1